MRKITPFLWFDGKAEDAARFYTSIFTNAKIESITPMFTMPAHNLIAPVRACVMAAARSMPGVCGVLGSSWSARIIFTPCSRQSIFETPLAMIHYFAWWPCRKGGILHVSVVRGLEFGVLRTVNGELQTRKGLHLHLRKAAIHEQFRSRDVAAVIGREKHHSFRNLIGRTEPAERNCAANHL